MKRLGTIAKSQMGRLGEPPLEAWTLDQASIQASAHRKSHCYPQSDTMCCTSQAEGSTVTPSQGSLLKMFSIENVAFSNSERPVGSDKLSISNPALTLLLNVSKSKASND